MNFEDLINITNINEHFAALAIDSYRRRFSDYLIEFRDRPMYKNNQNTTETFDTFIMVYGYELSLKTIEYFGNEIRSIRLTSNQNSQKSYGKFMESINKYCAESLLELQLWHIESDTLTHVTMPFEKVDNLLLKFDIPNLKTKMQLNQMFPALRRFKLIVDRNLNDEFIDCEMPHLDQLILYFVPRHMQPIAQNKIESFLRKNTHVRDLALENCGQFPVQANQLLPNIEILTLEDNFHEFSQRDLTPLRWENVKTLHLRSNRLPTSIAAPKLEEFHIAQKHHMDQLALMNFFENHSFIQRLHVEYLAWVRYNTELNAFTSRLPDLTEVYLKVAPFYRLEDLTNFIRSHRNLTIFQLDRIEIETKNALHETFDDEWHIDNFNTAGILMQKKSASDE